MAYRWNELDSQSSGVLKMLCLLLCVAVTGWYFRHQHPVLALLGGLLLGTALAQLIPPRWSNKRVGLTVLLWLFVGAIYAVGLAKLT